MIRRARGERSLAELARALGNLLAFGATAGESPPLPDPAATGKGGGGFGQTLGAGLDVTTGNIWRRFHARDLHTETHADILMFGDIAVQLLKLMGYSGTVPGAPWPTRCRPRWIVCKTPSQPIQQRFRKAADSGEMTMRRDEPRSPWRIAPYR